MSKQLLIEFEGERPALALVRDGRLLSFFPAAPEAEIQAEQVYRGVVDRIVRGMEAAFVRLGGGKMGFLPFSECKARPRSGDTVLVQVKRPPIGEKAASLTQDISLAGRFILLTPLDARCGVSKKIEDDETRGRLLALARRLAPPGMGLVMRTESQAASEEEIAAEAEALLAKWQAIAACALPAPCLAAGREDALSRLLRDERGEIAEALTNRPEALPPLPCPVRPCPQPFALYNVAAQWEKAQRRKHWLDCGGFLILDRTEALTVFDVNSGKFTGGKAGAEATFLKLNIEAAREIARLLRLRNLGGIILIDFVDMQSEESRRAVTEALEAALRDDPVKTALHGFTSLGLMEMTRKKTGDIAPVPTSPCPYCHGTGLREDTP